MEKERILIAEDDASSRESLWDLVSSWGYQTCAVANGAQALEVIPSFNPALILSDVVMPELDGIGLLRAVKNELQSRPVILLTGYGDIPTAKVAIKEGAVDYLTKPVDFEKLKELIEKCIHETRPLRSVRPVVATELSRFGSLVGRSQAMQEIYYQIQQVAQNPVSVLITGESGTGKELVARILHNLSPRKDKPFVAINASAIPDTLVESEIFGHEKGAFTDARTQRKGCFELADQGTLLLDEIAEMPLNLQPKLLRVLEERRLRRLGGTQQIPVDVRVVAATNYDLRESVDKQKLRADLYYRLAVFSIHLPPLRERSEDIPVLVEHFVTTLSQAYNKQVKQVGSDMMRKLTSYGWPGNVRELRNVIERAVVLCSDDELRVEHLSPNFRALEEIAPKGISLPVGITIADAEKWLIEKTLQETNNSKARAAAILGISERTLYNKLKTYRLQDEPESKENA